MRHRALPSFAFFAALSVVSLSPAQTGRTMVEVTPPVVGQVAAFAMNHPAAAIGRFNLFLISARFAPVLNIPIPGFTSTGSIRVDVGNLLGTELTVLDAGLQTGMTLAIPNVPNAVGFAFDVQTVDFDLVLSDLAWADNDLETTVQPVIQKLVKIGRAHV